MNDTLGTQLQKIFGPVIVVPFQALTLYGEEVVPFFCRAKLSLFKASTSTKGQFSPTDPILVAEGRENTYIFAPRRDEIKKTTVGERGSRWYREYTGENAAVFFEACVRGMFSRPRIFYAQERGGYSIPDNF